MFTIYLIPAFVVFALVFYFWKSRRNPEKNPFSSKCLQLPPAEIEIDRKKRKAVLKQKFDPELVPKDLDAIVIGSGIGGLSTAALLSKAGWKVLVLEQHGIAGGCTHTYSKQGFEFDVGIHYIGQLQPGTLFRTYIDQITNGQLDWIQLNENFDTVIIGDEKFPIMSGREKFKENLLKMFPDETIAIEKFVNLLNKTRNTTLGLVLPKMLPYWLSNILCQTKLFDVAMQFFKLNRESLQQVVEKMTDNKKLQAVFTYCFGDYGTLPSEGSWPMHSMLLTHFWDGVAYPRGGASEIAYQIIPVIEAAGGKVLVKANVSEILLNNGRACGVKVQLKAGTEHKVFAPVVISGAGITKTLTKFLPTDVAVNSRMYSSIRRIPVACSAVSLFVGLNGSSSELHLPTTNFWIFTEPEIDRISRDFLQMTSEQALSAKIPLLFASFASAKDHDYERKYPGKSCCTVVTFANYEWFKDWENSKHKKRSDDYDSFKKAFGFKMWDQILKDFPQLADKVEYFDVGSPVTNNHYIGSLKGEIYGLDHSKIRFEAENVMKLRPESDIPGLYLTGQDVSTCGFAGAAYGGLFCASTLLNRNLYDDLLTLRRELRGEKEKTA